MCTLCRKFERKVSSSCVVVVERDVSDRGQCHSLGIPLIQAVSTRVYLIGSYQAQLTVSINETIRSSLQVFASAIILSESLVLVRSSTKLHAHPLPLLSRFDIYVAESDGAPLHRAYLWPRYPPIDRGLANHGAALGAGA